MKEKILVVGDYEMFERSKRLFYTILNELGLSLDDVQMLNVIPGPKLSDDQLINIQEIRKWRPDFIKEVHKAKPKIIISLGATALKAIYDTNLISVGAERGKVLTWDEPKHGPVTVIPTYHPAYALRKAEFAKWIYADIKNGIEIANGTNDYRDSLCEYVQITAKNQEKALKEITSTGIAVTDLETSGLDMFDPLGEIIMVGFCNDKNKAWLYHKDTPHMIEFVQRVLNKIDLLIGHNIKFDLKWMLSRGLVYKKAIWDTLVAIHLIDENYPEKGLKALARSELKEFGQELAKHEAVIKAHWKAKTKPTLKEWIPYGGGDCIATFRLYLKFSKGIVKEGLEYLMAQEMRVLKVLTYMEMDGFHIDKKAFRKIELEYSDLIKVSEHKIKAILGDINIGSTQQLAEVLYKKMGLPILEETAGGSPSCSENALNLIMKTKISKENRLALEMLLKFRNHSKLYNTYIKGVIENGLIKKDGKIHCNYKITGTVTGRLSCSDPNLQNIPREGNIKLMFASRFPGGRIIQGDYSQAELRLLAHHAKSESLIQAFVSGRDIHQEVGAKVFKKAYEDVTEQERKFTKQVNFGIVYLISGAGLAEKLGISEREGSKLIREWFQEFPEVEVWIKKMKNQVVYKGYTTNIFGRKRRFFSVNPDTGEGREAQRQGVNAPIQGGSGDLTKWAMYKYYFALKKAGLKTVVMGNVHDAIMSDSPREEVDHAAKLLHSIATNPPMQLLVPMKMDLKVGPSWGELEKYEIKKEKQNGKS